jgi:hypothetical protein
MRAFFRSVQPPLPDRGERTKGNGRAKKTRRPDSSVLDCLYATALSTRPLGRLIFPGLRVPGGYRLLMVELEPRTMNPGARHVPVRS